MYSKITYNIVYIFSGQGIPVPSIGHHIVMSEKGNYKIVKDEKFSKTPSKTSENKFSVSSTILKSSKIQEPVSNLVGEPLLTSIISNSTTQQHEIMSLNPDSNYLPKDNSEINCIDDDDQSFCPNISKNKCTNFLDNLKKIAEEQSPDKGRNMKKLIKGLICGAFDSEVFTVIAQKELNCSKA